MRKSVWLGAALSALSAVSGAQAAGNAEIWHYHAAGSEKAGIDALIAYSNGKNPQTPVESHVIPGNVVELRRQLQAAFLGGQPPALYQSSMASELKTFVDGGRLHPLDDIWKEIRGDEIYPEGVRKVVTVDGKHYGVPFDLSLINNTFYNKAIFDKLKITPPTTWDEFKTTCKTLRDGGVEPLANAGGPFWSLYNFYAPLISTVGVDGYYKIASGELAFDSPEFKKALDLFKTTMVACYEKNWSGKTWTQAADDVVNGRAGMDMMGIWVAGYFKQAGFEPGTKFDFFPAPGTVGKAVFQMDVFAVPEGPADNEKAAYAFIKAATSVDGMKTFSPVKGSLAPNTEVPPSVYDYAGKKFAEEFATASKNNAVLPNLFFLLPTKVGDELGNQIERFAIDPSDANEKDMIATLEQARQDALAEKSYHKW